MLVVGKKMDYLKKARIEDGLRSTFQGVVYDDLVLLEKIWLSFSYRVA